MARLLTRRTSPCRMPIEVAGEIIRIFDPLVHRPARAWPSGAAPVARQPRTAPTRAGCSASARCVVTGGELTLEMLDLVFDPRAGYYQAPPHFKANNGLFLVDDLGRQLVTPRAVAEPLDPADGAAVTTT